MMPMAMAAFKLTQQAKQRHVAGDDLRTQFVDPFQAIALPLAA